MLAIGVAVESTEVVGEWDTEDALAEYGMNGDGDEIPDAGGVLGLGELGLEDCLSAERMFGGRGIEDGGVAVTCPWAEDGGVVIVIASGGGRRRSRRRWDRRRSLNPGESFVQFRMGEILFLTPLAKRLWVF